jgi:hypothetical protein
MACKARNEDGTTVFIVPEDKTMRDAGGKTLAPSPEVQAWWTHKLRNRRDETLLIRQEGNDPSRADVLELTLGQVYDLHHALGCLIMRS